MSGITSGLNPDLVKTELDRLFFSKFNNKPGPQIADITDSLIFNQDSASNSAVITEIMNDGGQWEQRTNELQNIAEATVIAGQKRTFTVTNFAHSLPVPKHFEDDEQWSAVRKSLTKMAQKGRLTDRVNGFGIYRNAFAGTLTNDGAALISDTHTNINGDTIDNKITAALTPDSLETLITRLIEQKDQSGDIVGHEARCLLVPPALFKEAVEITESKLEADTADNQLNVYSAKYGIFVKQSQYIGAAQGGSDTAFFLLSDDHEVYRWQRQAPITAFTPWTLTKNFVSFYKSEFRNVYGAISYEGIVASDGTT